MTEILLSLLAFALLVALLYREWAFDRERQVLLDRIQAPEAAATVAYHRALPPAAPVADTDAEDDAAYGRPVESFDFIDPEIV